MPDLFRRLERFWKRKPTPRTHDEWLDYIYSSGSPEEMEEITAWMRARAKSYDEKEKAQTADLLAWAKAASPVDWHRCAITFNWDYRIDVLRWIAAQSECDRGTAIHLFHCQRPYYYLPYASDLETFWRYYVGDRELTMLVTERWRAGQFKSYRFDPVVREGVPPGTLPWPVPDDLCVFEVAGEVVDTGGFQHGYPPHLVGAKLV
jgi:hypothetical protein